MKITGTLGSLFGMEVDVKCGDKKAVRIFFVLLLL